MTETGETSAQINARADDRAWPATRSALLRGAELRRPVGLKNYYAYLKDYAVSGTGITLARVNRLERGGELKRYGDVYKLVEPKVTA